MLIRLGRMLNAADQILPDSPSTPLIPLNTPLIFVGDSITNVSNSSSSNHRAWRHWFNVFTNGHFYCTPASNQGIGGAVLTQEVSATAYIGRREDWWLSQVREGAIVMFAIGTNDMSNAAATLAIMQATLQAHIDDVLALGGRVFLGKVLKGTANQTPNANPEINLTKWTAFNAWLDTLHDPANGVYTLGSRVDAIDISLTYLYDGLHPNGTGARLIGAADAADILPYLDTSESLLYGASAPGSNLEANWDLSGTGGTAGTGTSGDVATGWSAYCSSNGTSGGATIGVTATCSKTTVDIPGVGSGLPAQQIDVVGTTSALGILTLINQVVAAFEFGDYGEAWAYVKVSATDGSSAPVGVSTLYAGFGNIGAMFSKTVELVNAGMLTGAFTGVLRTVPQVRLSNSASENFEVSFGLISGAVDLRIVVAQMSARRAEEVAYGAPFNLGGAMFSGVQNPIGDRPRLNGTPGVGNSLTLQPSTINGGGPTAQECRVYRDGVTLLLTRVPGDTPMSYTQVAGDSGTTLTMEQDFTNSFGTITVTSAGIVVP